MSNYFKSETFKVTVYQIKVKFRYFLDYLQ